jgi:lipoprotein Spr
MYTTRPFRIIFTSFGLSILILFASCTGRTKTNHTEISPAQDKTILLQQKYASALGTDVLLINNITLYSFIDDWIGTPYLYGGKTKLGIDCSAFTETLYKNVYNTELKGSSRDLFTQCDPVGSDQLKEGDLVFFRIESENVSHVGVYLTNGKFVHATTKKGVMIDDLKEAYYTKYYYKGGRIEKNK